MSNDIGLYVSVLSLLVAALSAVYARRALTEARALALHSSRLEVSRAFEAVRSEVQRKTLHFSDVGAFGRLAREAKLYFSDIATVAAIEKYSDICFRLAECNWKYERDRLEGKNLETLTQEQDRLLEQEQSTFTEARSRIESELTEAVRRRSILGG